MKYHSKFRQLKEYSQRMKMIKLKILLRSQPDLYKSLINGEVDGQLEREEEDEIVEDQEMEMEEDDFNIAEYIHQMPLKLQKQFKANNPQLPQIFFMSPAQKKRYFETMNTKFQKRLAKAPQRKSRTKKRINFRPSFDIKGFNQNQKVVAVKKGLQLHQTYQQNIHFS